LCGIAGFTHRNWRPEAERIRDAAYSLVHRGPDQQGVWESDLVSLGAVRLKIIDLSGGDQPMVSDTGDAVIVFNGEIYNHPELRRELEGLGHRFHSRSDTEVALHAFLEWDLDCFRRLRGMFAAALWQQSRRRLVLARDRLGIKPLYIHRRGEDLYFGSELKAILEHPEIERRIDRTGLAFYLSLNYVPCPHTLVAGIRKLAPGHWLEWRDGALTTGAYWRLEFAPRERPLAQAKEELDFLLGESVREHLISDVPLGIWASGGIDSSTILHYAAQAAPARLKTFSVSFRGRSFDESPYFREVARAYQTDHHEFDLNPERDLEDAVGELAWYSDEPGADAGALPVWYLSKMCRGQVTVALSGEGADELFGGYYTYLADSLVRPLRLVPAFLRRGALKALELWPVSDDKISFEYKLKRFLAGSLLEPAAAHLFWNGTFSETDKEYLLAFDGYPPLASLTRSLGEDAGRLDDLSRFLWTDQRYYLPDDILYKCDRMSMAHSLEVRPPFLDHRIVEFAASLPIHLKVRGSKLKFLLKELMRDKLPPAILARRKEGFDIPAHDWLRGGLRPLLLETLAPEAVRRTGLFRAEAVAQAIQVHLDRRANLGYHLWGLLVLFLWMKRWGIETLAPERQSSAETEGFASVTN
jgi:asparagine synthase (glutamine-hydrolysing)